MKCAAAAAHSQSVDFDWTQPCAPEALKLTGMRSLLHEYIKTYRGAEAIRRAFEMGPDHELVLIREDTAMVWLNQRHLILYFTKLDGVWWISDISRPFAGE